MRMSHVRVGLDVLRAVRQTASGHIQFPGKNFHSLLILRMKIAATKSLMFFHSPEHLTTSLAERFP